MENNGDVIMHDMINTGRDDDEGDYSLADLGQHAYDIGIDPLFPNTGMSTEEGLTAAALSASLALSLADGKRISQRTGATQRQRIGSYAKLGWRYQPMPFTVLSKRDSTIGGRWANSSMSKGSCVKI
jgi:hypothetical protein